MGDRWFLRVLRFRPEGFTSVVDSAIRDAVLPAARRTSGLVLLAAGRRAAGDGPDRVIATVWQHDPGGGPQPVLEAEAALGPGSAWVAPADLSVLVAEPQEPAPTVLRVFEGEARPGQFDEYLAAARRGTAEDLAAGTGPFGLFLARRDGDRFVTVSTWAGWEQIQRATGGNIHQPISTRHTEHLFWGSASHYEIIPNGLVIVADAAAPDGA